jgi:hypothetical protein
MDKRGATFGTFFVLAFVASACMTGCVTVGREPVAPQATLDVCSAVAAGSSCELNIADGADAVTSRCTKQRDGSLVCDSPDLPGGGPRASASVEDGAR